MNVGWKQRAKRAAFVGSSLAVLLLVGWLAWQFIQEDEEIQPPIPGVAQERPLEEVTTEVFHANLAWSSPLSWEDSAAEATPESASLPTDVAVVDGRVFVLDTGNGRILEVAEDGTGARILDVPLSEAMAITAHNGKLYVANSTAGTILVVDPSGSTEREIQPQEVPSGEKPLRPIGIAVAPGGDIYLSDADNHRVLKLDPDGRFLSSIGSGQRDYGEYGFNTPVGLALDSRGNLFVVDMLNSEVKKYSPSGQFLLSVGEAGDTEGTFSRPKAVAVDQEGNIYISDGLLAAVEVFGPDGEYIGFIGREDPDDRGSDSVFQAPHGLTVVGDQLYVVDRFAGVFQFQLGA